MDTGMEIMEDIDERRAGRALSDRSCNSLMNELIKLQADPKRCRLMGERARKIFLEKYEKEVCLEKYKKLVFQLLGLNGENKEEEHLVCEIGDRKC